MRTRAQETDFKFMKNVRALLETPEIGVYNTALERNQGTGTVITAMYEVQ